MNRAPYPTDGSSRQHPHSFRKSWTPKGFSGRDRESRMVALWDLIDSHVVGLDWDQRHEVAGLLIDYAEQQMANAGD